MKKRLVSMVLILGMLIQFGGCSGMDLIGKEKLNERQKKILVENGLSADWKDLKYDQKESITANGCVSDEWTSCLYRFDCWRR